MGAPKQKWTEQEESALKAGVLKHGAGKWRAIQKDPSFRTALSARTNVDLKDKWRNLNIDSIPGKTFGPSAFGDKRGRARSDYAGISPKHEARKGTGRQRHDICQHNQLIVACKRLHVVFPSQLNFERQASLRSEDVILAAIIALDCPQGSSLPEIVHWAQVHYGKLNHMEVEINALLKALVTRNRLSMKNERYFLGGALSRFVLSEQDRSSSNEVCGVTHKPLSQDTVACLSAYAALAVDEAEQFAEYAEGLTSEADKLRNTC